MDFLTLLKYVLAVVETAALIGAMVFSARGFKEKKNQGARKSLLMKAAVYFAVYVVLNMVRLMYFAE
jgi:hypothetical protein